MSGFLAIVFSSYLERDKGVIENNVLFDSYIYDILG